MLAYISVSIFDYFKNKEMNSSIEKHLSPSLSKKLINYIENQLKTDLVNFEIAFGYKGNTSLIKWLIINNLFDGKEINFQRNEDSFLALNINIPDILLRRNIFNSIKKHNLFEHHNICNHSFGGFIQLFTSALMIGGDGMGNFFYANFHSTNSDIIFYDHENSLDSYKALTMDELLKTQPIQYLDLIVDSIVLEKGATLGLDKLDYKENFEVQHDGIFKDEIFNFMTLLGRNKSLSQMVDSSLTPFLTGKELSNLLTNKESDYHKYGNVRAEYNPIIVVNLYWYYLTNQVPPLIQLLDDSKNIKGKYYLAIRNSFQQLVRRDFSKFLYSYNDLSELRKNVNLQASLILHSERKRFAKEIEELEQKKAAEISSKLAHQEDDYFLLSQFGGWGLSPEDSKYRREKPLSNHQQWENPVPIATKLKHHFETSGEPKILSDLLPWLSGVTLGGKNLVVSERLKDILVQKNLQQHNFYPIHVKSYGKILSYFVFVPFLGEIGFEIIDYSKTIFYVAKRGAPKEILEDNIQVDNFQEHTQVARKYMEHRGEIKYKNQEICLNQPVDLFTLGGTGFFVSKKLKLELEEKNITLQFEPLDKFARILAFTKINVSNSITESIQPTETVIENKEAISDESKIKNIIDFVGETVLEKSKIPEEIQQNINLDFSQKEEQMMLILIQKILPSHMGTALANSLLLLSKGKLENINNCFPIYDPRDVIARAQALK